MSGFPVLGERPYGATCHEVVSAATPGILAAAQEIYDGWVQEDGFDEEFGGGGICHEIASRIVGVLNQAGVEHLTTFQAAVGENHVYAIELFEDGVFTVDIPAHVYETGSAFTWTKKPGVTFDEAGLVVEKLSGPIDPAEFEATYCE